MFRTTGLISFAGGSPAWRRVRKRFQREAFDTGFFGPIEIYDDKRLSKEFPEFFDNRQALFSKPSLGFGFWSWKPFLIQKFLEEMHPKCERVVFLDAGSHFNVNHQSRKRFREYEELVDQNGYLFMKMNHLIEREWTSSEVLDYFRLGQRDRASGQIVGGFNIWTHQDKSLSLLSTWDAAMTVAEGRLLRGSVGQQEPHLRAHRHDQSLLSCLVKKNGAFAISDETDFYPDFDLGTNFPIWTVRNSTRFGFQANSQLRGISGRTDYVLSLRSRFMERRRAARQGEA